MLGGAQVWDPVPYFWSEQWGRMVQYAGHHPAGERIVWREDGERWAAFWLAGDRLVAALTVDRPRDLVQARHLMERDASVDAALLADPSVGREGRRGLELLGLVVAPDVAADGGRGHQQRDADADETAAPATPRRPGLIGRLRADQPRTAPPRPAPRSARRAGGTALPGPGVPSSLWKSRKAAYWNTAVLNTDISTRPAPAIARVSGVRNGSRRGGRSSSYPSSSASPIASMAPDPSGGRAVGMAGFPG